MAVSGTRTYISPGRYVIVYPNVIELWQNNEKVIAYTPEEWGALVEIVGIKGLWRDADS